MKIFGDKNLRAAQQPFATRRIENQHFRFIRNLGILLEDVVEMFWNDPRACPYYLVSRVTLVVTSALKKRLAEAGVPHVKPAYLWSLIHLWNEDGLKVVDLGKRSGLEASTMSGLLDRMERDGLVTRVPDPSDRRVLRINLTDEGRRVRDPVIREVEQLLSEVLDGIPDEEIARTTNLLQRILDRANQLSG